MQAKTRPCEACHWQKLLILFTSNLFVIICGGGGGGAEVAGQEPQSDRYVLCIYIYMCIYIYIYFWGARFLSSSHEELFAAHDLNKNGLLEAGYSLLSRAWKP